MTNDTHSDTIVALRYSDDLDRSLGASGMAVAMMVLGGENMLAGLNIDAEPDDMVEFMPEYYFEGNPRLMASAAWRRLLGNFNLTAGMLVGNVLCRRIIGRGAMPADEERDYLRGVVVEEGTTSCSLEPEEANSLFDNNYEKFSRVFLHRGVRSVASELAEALMAARAMSRMEVMSHLSSLRML
ncbi:MAG: hypothetical protein NC187_05975 [Candidatus Amulumruptor caecigallinarius]|nr:hypothetical protein [Candidatus Amulumruptor caecigallinarius]MCM1397017.1 hypothetical protein [Candidatus Amulumruptor caecigallinarius]MCM1454046.1 hypothetical protein [bacterium]